MEGVSQILYCISAKPPVKRPRGMEKAWRKHGESMEKARESPPPPAPAPARNGREEETLGGRTAFMTFHQRHHTTTMRNFLRLVTSLLIDPGRNFALD